MGGVGGPVMSPRRVLGRWRVVVVGVLEEGFGGGVMVVVGGGSGGFGLGGGCFCGMVLMIADDDDDYEVILGSR